MDCQGHHFLLQRGKRDDDDVPIDVATKMDENFPNIGYSIFFVVLSFDL